MLILTSITDKTPVWAQHVFWSVVSTDCLLDLLLQTGDFDQLDMVIFSCDKSILDYQSIRDHLLMCALFAFFLSAQTHIHTAGGTRRNHFICLTLTLVLIYIIFTSQDPSSYRKDQNIMSNSCRYVAPPRDHLLCPALTLTQHSTWLWNCVQGQWSSHTWLQSVAHRLLTYTLIDTVCFSVTSCKLSIISSFNCFRWWMIIDYRCNFSFKFSLWGSGAKEWSTILSFRIHQVKKIKVPLTEPVQGTSLFCKKVTKA